MITLLCISFKDPNNILERPIVKKSRKFKWYKKCLIMPIWKFILKILKLGNL